MTCHRVAAESLIERYLQGTLDPAVRGDFEDHYFECEACFVGLQTVQAIRPVLATMPRPAIAKRPSPLIPWIGLAAAAAVTMVVLSWPKPTPTPVAALPPVVAPAALGAPVTAGRRGKFLLAEIQPAPYAPAIFRDGAGGAGPDFDAAMRLYQDHHWKDAAQALETVARTLPNNAAALHFAGISHLLASQTEAALASLDRVIAIDSQSPFEEEARFYRAQALLLGGHRAEGRQELERVIQRRGDYEALARSLLNRF